MVNESSTLNDAYFDRNQGVMALARICLSCGFPVGFKDNADDPDWPILFIQLPQGQVSWHLPKAEIIGEWPVFRQAWDGHTLEKKRQRLIEFIAELQ